MAAISLIELFIATLTQPRRKLLESYDSTLPVMLYNVVKFKIIQFTLNMHATSQSRFHAVGCIERLTLKMLRDYNSELFTL